MRRKLAGFLLPNLACFHENQVLSMLVNMLAAMLNYLADCGLRPRAWRRGNNPRKLLGLTGENVTLLESCALAHARLRQPASNVGGFPRCSGCPGARLRRPADRCSVAFRVGMRFRCEAESI